MQAARFLARSPRPTRPARSVPRRQVRGDLESSAAQRLTILNHPHVVDAWKCAQLAELGVIRAGTARLQDLGTRRAGRNLGAAQPLQPGDSTGVVEMDMGIEDQLHVLDAKPEGA